MNKPHFHRWEELELVSQKLDNGIITMTTYRYCKCGKWQKQMGTYEKNWWEECEKPDSDIEKYNVGE